MRAIILAAGRGSRLKEITKNKPKCFLNISEKSIIEHQIDSLRKFGIKKIAVVAGYRKNFFKRLNIKIFINDKWNTSNMVYSLFNAKSWLFDNNCLICYGDIFYDENILSELIKEKGSFVLPSNNNWKKHWKMKYKNPLNDLETFKINKNMHLLQIGSRPKNYSEIQGQFMGLMKIKKSASQDIFKIFNLLSKKIQKKNSVYRIY